MILLIDNYDSFSYNLVQMLGQIRPDIRVVRNDAVTIHEIRAMNRITWFSRPVRDIRRARESWNRRYGSWRANCPSWASAWAIRESARPSEAGS